jgi:hypothetical protein
VKGGLIIIEHIINSGLKIINWAQSTGVVIYQRIRTIVIKIRDGFIVVIKWIHQYWDEILTAIIIIAGIIVSTVVFVKWNSIQAVRYERLYYRKELKWYG